MKSMKDNLDDIRERIDAACRESGRSTDDVELMAVSKTRSFDEIMEAYNLGLRLFGENRVQEIRDKFTSPPDDLELHLIGHLQSNKAKVAVEHTSSIHSIDKLKTAMAVEKACLLSNKKMKILLEVNTSGEDNKNGFRGKVQFFETIEKILELKMVKIAGLMTMAPFSSDEKVVRPCFRELNNLKEETLQKYPELDLSVLSMGMSSDFDIAIQEGATLIRVGTLLFGARKQ